MAIDQTYAADLTAAEASAEERSAFIRRTYGHLAATIALFAGLETLLLGPLLEKTLPMMAWMVQGWHWLIVLGAFVAVGWIADWWARQETSTGLQYAGLFLTAVAYAVIMMPLLYLAAYHSSPDLLPTAAILTLGLVVGLTAVVFVTRKDFSFLRSALMIGTLIAFGVIVCAIIFGFNLGVLFALAMVVLMAGYLLYYTSNVLHHYQTSQHVAAALALFAAIAMMFYYIVFLLMSLSRD
jgi:hypothetical protein